MNPYLAGIFLGLAILAAFLILGSGFSASEGLSRLASLTLHQIPPAAPQAGAPSGSWLSGWLPGALSSHAFFMLLGLFAGALVSALMGKRLRFQLERGPVPLNRRLLLVLAGGILAGLALGLAQGGLFDQMLHGGVLLYVGAFVFLLCFLIAGYAATRLLRRVLS